MKKNENNIIRINMEKINSNVVKEGVKVIFSNTTKYTSTSTMIPTTQSTFTTTKTPNIFVENNNNELSEKIDDLEVYLIIITIQLTLIVLFKLLKLCKKGYKIHNEKIIKKHTNTSERL